MADGEKDILMEKQVFEYDALKTFSEAVFLKIGCSRAHARKAADVLVSADLRGVDTHGVARLSSYVRLWENGRINAAPDIQVVRQTPSTAVLDGDSGLGLIVAPEAMALVPYSLISVIKNKKSGEFIEIRNLK